MIPDWYYNFYGDPRPLADNYDCMKRWVLFQQRAYQKLDHTIDYCNYGDWVNGSWIKGTLDKRTTSRPLMSTAYSTTTAGSSPAPRDCSASPTTPGSSPTWPTR